MKEIIFPMILMLTACSYGPLSAPTPTPTSTQTPTWTATRTASLTRTQTPTLTTMPTATKTATQTATRTPANLPTYAEGVTFPAGLWKLRVTMQRGWKVKAAFIQNFEYDCRIDQRVCMVIRVQVMSGEVTYEEMDGWSLAVEDDSGSAGEELTRLKGGYSTSHASYGIWVLEVNPASVFYTIRLLNNVVITKNSSIRDVVSFP